MTVEVEREGAVARVWMNRPEKHNAFNAELIDDLSRTFENLGRDSAIRVVVLGGRGPSFSAGADLQWMKEQSEATWEDNLETARRAAHLFEVVETCPHPVVVRVHGPALGGGSGLVCAGDIALASPHAVFGFTEVRWGLVPAVIGPLMIRRLGFSQARYLGLTGSRFPASEAHRIGLVHEISEKLDDLVESTVGALLKGAPSAHTATKKLFTQLLVEPVERHPELTTQATAVARASEAGRQGRKAFLEGRKPDWSL